MSKTSYTWSNGGGGTWSTGADWNLGTVPGSGGSNGTISSGGSLSDVVVINDGATVTYDQTTQDQISSLTVSGNSILNFNAGTSLWASTTIIASAGTLNVLGGNSLLRSNNLGAGSSSVVDIGGGGTLELAGSLSIGTSVLESTTGTGNIINYTTSTALISGSGSILAAGGTLAIAENVGSISGAGGLSISNTSSSAILLTGALSATDTINFQGSLGYFGTSGSLASGDVVSGLDVSTLSGTSAPTSSTTDYIDFTGQKGVTVNSGFVESGSSVIGNKITLSNNTTLNLTNIGGSSTGTWYVDAVSDSNGGTDIFLSTQVCYAAGTRVLTATGEREMELLQPGDIVLTLVNGTFDAQPIKWIGRRHLDLTAHPRPATAAPIQIRRGAFAEHMPHRDLLVSPDHAILVDGTLICARQLVNGTTIRQRMDLTSVDYFHIELDTHAILLAEGLPAESYLDTGNRGFFTNGDAPLILHPDLTDETDQPAREAGSCAPFVSDEAGVRPVWLRLAQRAAALGQPVPRCTATEDLDLHLIVRGGTVRPLYGENGLYVFAVPKGATDVRLMSRSTAPTVTRPWLEDRRRLGAYVARMVLRGAHDVRELPVDHPGLAKGWWSVERDGTALRRWTNGDAVLSLPMFDHPAMLEIHASTGGLAYPVDIPADHRAA